jgi:hypothetical protein
MKKEKKDKTVELIVSYGTELIGGRFRVKVSVLDNGVNPQSFLVVTQDLLEGGFSMKYCKDKEQVALLLQLFKMC